jgi:hypothetical protein
VFSEPLSSNGRLLCFSDCTLPAFRRHFTVCMERRANFHAFQTSAWNGSELFPHSPAMYKYSLGDNLQYQLCKGLGGCRCKEKNLISIWTRTSFITLQLLHSEVLIAFLTDYATFTDGIAVRTDCSIF